MATDPKDPLPYHSLTLWDLKCPIFQYSPMQSYQESWPLLFKLQREKTYSWINIWKLGYFFLERECKLVV